MSAMSPLPIPVSVSYLGMIHRGCYRVDGGQLIVEAFGLGVKSADASVLEGELGRPAEKMAKLLLMEQVKESSTDIKRWAVRSAAGSTTRISYA